MSGQVREPAAVTTDWQFAQIPEALLYDPTISPQAVRVYGCLLRHGLTPDSCFPSHARISEKLGLSERSVARPVKELETAGWITRTRRFNAHGERIADGYHVITTAAARAQVRLTTTSSSAKKPSPPRDRVFDQSAESRGLEKQREPVNESKKVKTSAPTATNEDPPDPLHEDARACARFAHEQRPKPITPYLAVQARCFEVLKAGWSPDDLCAVIHEGDVTWTRAALEFRLNQRTKPKAGKPTIDEAAAAWRKRNAG